MSYIAKIHECKGRQELFTRQKSVELERLIKIARVQSTEASNKIEGIVARVLFGLLVGFLSFELQNSS